MRWCSAQYLERAPKFGLKLPKMVKEAYAINKNKSTLWQDIIQKEIENVKITFQIIPEGEKPPTGSQYINCDIVFDIKMKDFHRKACLVAGGHMTHTGHHIQKHSLVHCDHVLLDIGNLHYMYLHVNLNLF